MSEQAPPRWSIAALAGAPALSLLVYALIPLPAARRLALDYESWLVNTYNIEDRVDLAWVLPGGWLLLLGAAPLFTLAISAMAYRLLARSTTFVDPLAGRPPAIRVAIGAAVLLPWLAHLAPLALALSVGLSVEVFWWIQWHGNTEPAMELTLTRAPLVLAACAALFALLTAAWALPGAHANRSRWWLPLRWTARITWLLLVAVLALASAHGTRSWGTPGRAVFAERCDQCHVRAEALYYVKTPAEWQRTVERMKDYEYPPLYEDETDAIEQITDEDEAAVVPFLCGMRSFSDAWTFRTRCQRCHGLDDRHWEDRPPENWARVPERVARWSPYYYRPDVRDQIAAHLAATRGDEAVTFDLDAETYASLSELDLTCGSCHSVTREFERFRRADDANRQAVIRRMLARSGEVPTDAQVTALTDRWSLLIADTSMMVRLFPHDQPMRDGWMSW
jgi:hypothetical protein